MTVFMAIVTICNGIMAIAALVIAIKKPIKHAVETSKQDNEAIKCLLRTHILNTYLKDKADKSIDKYERQNIDMIYNAYVARGGNSFVQDIYEEIRDWNID